MFKIASAQYPMIPTQSFSGWQNHVETWVAEAVANQAELLVFPEYGSLELIPLLSSEQQKSLALLAQGMDSLKTEFVECYRKLAQKYNCHILTSSLPVLNVQRQPINRCYFVSPSGQIAHQDKQHMTRFEDEKWGMVAGDPVLSTFESPWGLIGINICYDVEFPEAANALAKKGVKLLLAPSCTGATSGSHRVHVGARARALENQFYVVVSQTVGAAPWSLVNDTNAGLAAVYGPPDLGFPEDGIVAKGELNAAGWIYSDVDFSKVDQVREFGHVFNFKHS